MRTGSHARPAQGQTAPSRPRWRPRRRPEPDNGRAPRGWWRVGTPLVVLLCGGLFAVSAANSEGTDLRPGRYTDLASLVSSEAERYDRLQDRLRELDADVQRLAAGVKDRDVNRLQREVEQLRDPAGLEPRRGPGLRITLSDAPFEVIDASSQDPNLMIVHQQDIQAVVNALWRGGATAMTIQGQRVISTTGIKCEGNAILLQGRPYPQPYVIEAVGDPYVLSGSLDADASVTAYREQAAMPDIALGWELETLAEVEAPAYDGLLGLSYAEPLP